jgi:osmotically-inducible protein OsmY
LDSSILETQKFHLGSRVVCSDGEEGALIRIGFDGGAHRISYIGIRQGRFFGKTVYLPYTSVVHASGDGVILGIPSADVFSATKDAPNAVYLDSKSVVDAGGQGRGSLSTVAVQPDSGELAYIVAHHLRPGQDTLLSQEYITAIAADRINITISAEKLQAIPAYRADADLQRDVESVLNDLTSLHVDFKGMVIRVLDGVLYVSGNISSSLRSDIVTDQASGVPGLLGIKNTLVGDDTLAADLARALGDDKRTQDLPIGVYPRLGLVRLGGAVHTQQQKDAAEEIARSFPHVTGVSNTLVVKANEELLHVMAPAEGGEANDIVPGKYIRHTK